MLVGRRPNNQGPALVADAAKFMQILQIHQLLGLGEAQFHHRDQTVAAGDDAGVLPMPRQ
jgi:hypothetical protein